MEDLFLIQGIIRKSLAESRQAGYPADRCRQLAIFHALKSIYILCKDRPRNVHVEVTGIEQSHPLSDFIEVMMQPDYQAIMHMLPEMVRVEVEASNDA